MEYKTKPNVVNPVVVILVLLNLSDWNLRKKGNLHLGQHYSADETALLCRSLARNTQAFKDEDKVLGNIMSKDAFSALLGANASGTHRL